MEGIFMKDSYLKYQDHIDISQIRRLGRAPLGISKASGASLIKKNN